jgi:hypothetical protein
LAGSRAGLRVGAGDSGPPSRAHPDLHACLDTIGPALLRAHRTRGHGALALARGRTRLRAWARRGRAPGAADAHYLADLHSATSTLLAAEGAGPRWAGAGGAGSTARLARLRGCARCRWPPIGAASRHDMTIFYARAVTSLAPRRARTRARGADVNWRPRRSVLRWQLRRWECGVVGHGSISWNPGRGCVGQAACV